MKPTNNVALVVLDTMRKDSFDKYFGWLQSEGVTFENAWSTSHWTVPAHASLFTGLYASEVGTHARNRPLQPTDSNLAELLSAAGYRTRGLTANTSAGPEFNFGQGFDRYENTLDRTDFNQYVDEGAHAVVRFPKFLYRALGDPDPSTAIREGIRNKVYHSPFRKYLDDGANHTHREIRRMDVSSPEFLFLNLMEAHSPYNAPVAYQTGPTARLNSLRASLEGPEDEEQTIRGAYADSVRYLSDKYRALHETLTEDFDYIITVADHGEAFGEYDTWGHTVHLSPEITNVPLTITGPAVERGGDRIHAAVNLLDVYQTVCDAANVTPPDHTRGSSLLDPDTLPDDRECYVETHGLTFNEQDMMDRLNVSEDTRERYAARRGAVATTDGYAFEQVDGSLMVLGTVPDARERIQTFGNRLDTADVDSEPTEVPSHIQDRLKELGYA